MANSSITNLASELKPSTSLDSTPVADQSLTVSTSAVAMMATAAATSTKYVVWSLTGADAMVTFDGSDPAGSKANGIFIAANSSSEWSIELANAARWIRDDATDARLHISELAGR